jgi:hypothetical protein
MNDLKAKRIYLRNKNKEYGSALVQVPISEWPHDQKATPIAVFRSKDFLLCVYQDKCYLRLTVCRTALNAQGGWKDGITWDELQRLKSEAGYDYLWAVECYPPDECLVNVANMRHLFLLHQPPAYGWHPLENPAILP